MDTVYVITIISVIIFVFLSILTIKIMRKRTKKKMVSGVDALEIKKNNLNSMPVMVQISKIEEIAKSEQLEEKINDFKVRYQEVKETKLTKIMDMITDLDTVVGKNNIKKYVSKYADIEMELDEAEYSLNNIMNEIEEIASYEEKYRNIVTKLKVKYRYLEHCYTEKETLFKDLQDVIKMQFENIAKRFNDFDKVIEEKLYNEVVLVVKSIDTMIDNLDVVIKELPDILLLLNDLIPGRINDLDKEYASMKEEGYPLAYLNYENNISDIKKRENDILTRAKVLNISNSLLDLRTILEYLDSLFKDLDDEKKAKIKFDKLEEAFNNKVNKLNNIVKDIYNQLDDIKALYHLNEKDLSIIDSLNLKLSSVIKEHKKLIREIKKGIDSYKKHNIVLNELLDKINHVSQDFDNALRNLGSFYDDEMRAHEELKNMVSLVKKCKSNIRNNHLPILYDNFYVELEEAEDAISEVKKEIDNKPIVIKNLNMRVDTARDLTFKLYKNTTDMIMYADFIEILIVFGNKYRDNKNVDKGLEKAELLYYSGSYQESFNLLLKVVKTFDEELANKINKLLKQ